MNENRVVLPVVFLKSDTLKEDWQETFHVSMKQGFNLLMDTMQMDEEFKPGTNMKSREYVLDVRIVESLDDYL